LIKPIYRDFFFFFFFFFSLSLSQIEVGKLPRAV